MDILERLQEAMVIIENAVSVITVQRICIKDLEDAIEHAREQLEGSAP